MHYCKQQIDVLSASGERGGGGGESCLQTLTGKLLQCKKNAKLTASFNWCFSTTCSATMKDGTHLNCYMEFGSAFRGTRCFEGLAVNVHSHGEDRHMNRPGLRNELILEPRL